MSRRGHNDTEIIPELFVRCDPELFTLLNDMFALAIYDRLEKIFTIARYPVGIKPLFYYADE